MSDYNENFDTPNNPVFSHKPWVGIAVPFCVVAVIAIAVLIFIAKRRRNRKRRNGLSLNQQGRLALERDILEDGLGEAGGIDTTSPQAGRGYRTGQGQGSDSYFGGYFGGSSHDASTSPPFYPTTGTSSSLRGTGGRRQPRTANRWAWANTINLTTISGAARREEGLNELGEAPPPYEVPKSPKVPGEEQPGQEVATESVSVPTPAHIRGGPERRSLDGDTIAATTTATTASRSRTTSSTSLEPIPTSPTEASSSSSSSSAATSSSTSPPTYSESSATKKTDR